ncbi:MAG: hypothetical protein AAF690_19555 [Acidobacteriota bacterium]
MALLTRSRRSEARRRLTHRAVVSAESLNEQGELSRAGWCEHFAEASLYLAHRARSTPSSKPLELEVLESALPFEVLTIHSRSEPGRSLVVHEAIGGQGRLLARAREEWLEPPKEISESAGAPPLLRRVFRPRHRGQAGHVNIQNFAQAIADAAAAQLGANAEARALRIRFLAELHPGDPVSLFGAFRPSGERVEFRGLVQRDRDEVVACRWQSFWNAEADDVPATSGEFEELRSVAGEVSSGWIETYRGTVEPRDVDAYDRLTQRGLWDLMTRALWGLQNRLACHRSQLAELGLSAAASTFDLELEAPSQQGDPLVCRTALLGRGRTSLRFVHQVRCAEGGQLRCSARYVLTFFDPVGGRPVELPTPVLERIDALPAL